MYLLYKDLDDDTLTYLVTQDVGGHGYDLFGEWNGTVDEAWREYHLNSEDNKVVDDPSAIRNAVIIARGNTLAELKMEMMLND